MDVSRCMKRLNWNERHAVFLIGIAKLTSRETGALMSISHTHAINHLNSGKARLLHLMNGGD